MATATRTYGPEMHGLRMTDEEFSSAPWREGYTYELIHGRVVVAARPVASHDLLDEWIGSRLRDYRRSRPDIINYLSMAARVFVPGFENHRTTCPEPDVAAYFDPRIGKNFDEIDWSDVSPLLVVETLSADNSSKDLVRNVRLYEMVPSIKEYWIIDGLDCADRPSLIVYRRRGRGWQKPIHVPYRGTYSTKLLPGFSLVVDPHAE